MVPAGGVVVGAVLAVGVAAGSGCAHTAGAPVRAVIRHRVAAARVSIG